MIVVNLTPLDLEVVLPNGAVRPLPASALAGSVAASRLALAGEDLTRYPAYAVRHYPLDRDYDAMYAYIVTEFQKCAWPDRRAVYGITSKAPIDIFDDTGAVVAKVRVADAHCVSGGIL